MKTKIDTAAQSDRTALSGRATPIAGKQPGEERQAVGVPNETFLTEQQLACRWNLSVKALQKWRLQGGGPEYCKIGKRLVRYPLSSVLRFETATKRAHTADCGQPK